MRNFKNDEAKVGLSYVKLVLQKLFKQVINSSDCWSNLKHFPRLVSWVDVSYTSKKPHFYIVLELLFVFQVSNIVGAYYSDPQKHRLRSHKSNPFSQFFGLKYVPTEVLRKVRMLDKSKGFESLCIQGYELCSNL